MTQADYAIFLVNQSKKSGFNFFPSSELPDGRTRFVQWRGDGGQSIGIAYWKVRFKK